MIDFEEFEDVEIVEARLVTLSDGSKYLIYKDLRFIYDETPVGITK